jgi:adenylate cyclase
MSRLKLLALSYLLALSAMAWMLSYPLHFLDTLRLKTEDVLFDIRQGLGYAPKAPEDMVIVAIDDASVHHLGRWPWDRNLMAALIDRMSGAKLVALDIVFSEPQNPQADAALAQSIRNHGSIIAGFIGRNDSEFTLTPEALDQLSISEYQGYRATGETLGVSAMKSLNVNVSPILSAPLASAPFTAIPDSDGLYRNYPIGTMYEGLMFCNLALQSFRYATQREIEMTISPERIFDIREGERVFVPINGQFLALNYYDPASTKVISAKEVLEGRAAEAIQDKVVFLGVTEMGIYDMRPTPISSVTPGVLLHYTAYGNLIEGSFLRHYPYASWIASGVLLLLTLGMFRVNRIRWRLAGYLLIVAGWMGLSIWLFIDHATVLPLFYPLVAFLLGVMINESITLFFSEARIKDLRKAFSSYVSPELLELITAHPDMLSLGGEKKEITILFSDIRNFTSLSESMAPDKLLSLLNTLLDPMTEEVLRHGGMMDKYIGDAIMALYNVPLDQNDHEKAAALSALSLMQVLHRLNRELNLSLDIGIGIHTGEAIIGNVGSKNRFDYTAIGDSVNLASRLEGLTKSYHAHIILSETLARKLDETFLLRPLDRVRVKGKHNAVMIYELLEMSDENRRIAESFATALQHYFEGDFQSAYSAFSALLPDGPSTLMVERCTHLIATPPQSWDGIWTMTTK